MAILPIYLLKSCDLLERRDSCLTHGGGTICFFQHVNIPIFEAYITCVLLGPQ